MTLGAYLSDTARHAHPIERATAETDSWVSRTRLPANNRAALAAALVRHQADGHRQSGCRACREMSRKLERMP